MASYDRLKHDTQGRIFVPINVDLQYDNDSFLTLPKGIVIFGSIFAYAFLIFWGVNVGLTALGWIVTIAFLTFIVQFLVRHVVFQEKYFFKQWTTSKKLGKPKASRFWNIASIRKTSLGDILVFSDLKLGVILELEKDTIIGKASDNEERHYDAWSEFYRSIFDSRLYLAQMNLMQPAGRDERFNEISDIAQGATNKNVRNLLELNTARMKSVSADTLDEHDYLLIYTRDMNRMNTLLNDALECGMCLMDGAYVGARILSEANIYQLPRENFNVTFFDGVEAQMNVYRTGGYTIKNPFSITSLEFEGRQKVNLTPELQSRLEKASKLLDNEKITYMEWDVVKALNNEWGQRYEHATGDKRIVLDGDNTSDSDTSTEAHATITAPSTATPLQKAQHQRLQRASKLKGRSLTKNRKRQSDEIDADKLQSELEDEANSNTPTANTASDTPIATPPKTTSQGLLKRKAKPTQEEPSTHKEQSTPEEISDDEVLF